jgi:hypothetical protein
MMSSQKGDDPFNLGGGLNPLNWPTRLSQYRTKDPNADGAREVSDPHKWENPDPSRKERLTPNTTAGWLFGAVVFFVVGGLTLYLMPIFGPAFRNEMILGGVGVVSFLILYYLWARHQGFRAAMRVDKSIVYYGDEADVRVGEHQGTDGKSHLFTEWTDISYGGFNPRPLKRRDLPYDPARLRATTGRKDEVGEEPVVDRLNRSTVEVDTETVGKVLVTHADGMQWDEFGQESDRYTTRPATIDEDVARQMTQLIESLERSITSLNQQITMLEERVDDIRDTKQAAITDELRGALNLMESMADLAAKQRYPQQSSDDMTENSQNGTGPVEAIDQDIEEELEGQY